MLAITATSDKAFPLLEVLDYTLETEIKEDERDRALTLARVKELFGVAPEGFELWDTPLMDAFDAVFKEWFVSKDDDLHPEFGTDHQWHQNRWRAYGEDIVKAAQKHMKPLYEHETVSRILARLRWFMSDDNEHHHHRLPFPTATCLRLVGERLLFCEVALTEVSGQHH